MTIKVIIFDVDWVLLQVPHYFSQEIEKRGHKNAVTVLGDFYKNKNPLCAEWKAEAIQLIVPYLEKIWWNKWAEEYFKEQFEFEKKYLNTPLISIISKIQKQGIKCYLWTDQEKNRAQYLLDWMEFWEWLDWHFISCNIWAKKSLPEFWYHVKKDLLNDWINKDEIVFFDDLQSNIDVANTEGIEAFLFTDIEEFEKDLVALWIKK